MTTVAGMFETRSEAEDAIQRLQAAGFSRDSIGIAIWRDRAESGDLADVDGVERLERRGRDFWPDLRRGGRCSSRHRPRGQHRVAPGNRNCLDRRAHRGGTHRRGHWGGVGRPGRRPRGSRDSRARGRRLQDPHRGRTYPRVGPGQQRGSRPRTSDPRRRRCSRGLIGGKFEAESTAVDSALLHSSSCRLGREPVLLAVDLAVVDLRRFE